MIVKSTQKGFTLIETLVAVMILATSIVGPLSIAARSLNNSIVAKDQVSAYFLAQDAVEYLRFERDTNRLNSADWLTGLVGAVQTGVDLKTNCETATGCYVDTTSNSYVDSLGNDPSVPAPCPVSGCPLMWYDTPRSRFTYETTATGATRSLFTRQIILTQVSATEEKLTVNVSWKDVGGTTRTIVVVEEIYAWQ